MADLMTDLQTDPSGDIDLVVAEWESRPFQVLTVDLYRDIHKGLRSELFAITEAAGSADPGSAQDRAAVADHVLAVGAVLASHAEHEDRAVQPALEVHLPALAERIDDDHVAFEATFDRLMAMAVDFGREDQADGRRLGQLLHLDLSSFVAGYLDHLVIEERVVMPALDAAIGPEAVLGIHQDIVGSIPPDEMGRSLSFMLGALNADDRADLLGGMQAGAPPEVFAAVLDLARSVLTFEQYVTLTSRLGV